jgi:hypothetical protein
VRTESDDIDRFCTVAGRTEGTAEILWTFYMKAEGPKTAKAAAGCCWSLELEFPEVLRSLSKGWRGST